MTIRYEPERSANKLATVIITITDAPGGTVNTTVESRHPPIPLVDKRADLEKLTNAQTLAIGVVMEIADRTQETEWRTLLYDPDAA